MTPAQEHDLAVRICNGNKEAEDWLQLLRVYVHLIDNIVDEDLATANRARGAERICEMGALALRLYTHPFFLKSGIALHTAMLSATVAYADSVAWEKEPGWKGVCSDWMRHGSQEVVLIIAAICGGYPHMRAVSQEVRTLSYDLHHDQDGAPV